MSINEDIKQKEFKSAYHKATINIIYTNNWISQLNQKVFKSFGLTNPQFNILRILRGQYPNASTVNLLIERMLDKSSNASRIVDKLEAKGLVIRKQCPSDRRAVDVYISEVGLELLEKMDAEMEPLEQRNKHLNEQESEELSRLLDKMRASD